jgi:small subunit ribosomal protein S6
LILSGSFHDKVHGTIMNYELLYLSPAQFTDDETEQIKVKVTALIEKAGVKITRNDNLGKFKLAYPIGQVRHGFYILVEFNGETEAIQTIERELRLLADVLRHQVIRLPEKIEAKKGKAKKEIKMVSYEAPGQDEEKPSPKREQPKKPVPKKVNLEELDKKLDEILESDVKV